MFTMRKFIILLAIVSIAFVSCTKNEDTKVVNYMVTGLSDPYDAVFFDNDGNSISKTVIPGAFEYEWNKSYEIKNGEPVYLYIKFKENIDNSPKFSVGIIIDGKYQYQRKGYDKTIGDTIYEVKVAGIVPIN